MKLVLPLIILTLGLSGTPLAGQTPVGSPAAQIKDAAEARAAGEYDRARQILHRLLDASPDDPDLLRRLAMVEAADGKLGVALIKIEEAARLAPNDLDIAMAHAYILYWRGDILAAQTAVAAITAIDPEYPELAELAAAIDREGAAREPHLRALSVGGSLSDIELQSGAKRTWSNHNLVVAADVSENDTVTMGVMREDRGAVDTRLSGRIDHRLLNGFVYVAATAVPNADFQEKWSMSAGGEMVLSTGLAALVDLRSADYDTGTIIAFQPGLRIGLGRDFSVTGRAINIFGGGEDYRVGGSIRLDYRREEERSLFAALASYPDVEADGVQQLRSLAAGFAVPISGPVALSGAASYENRENSYRRWTGTLALTYRFGAR